MLIVCDVFSSCPSFNAPLVFWFCKCLYVFNDILQSLYDDFTSEVFPLMSVILQAAPNFGLVRRFADIMMGILES